MRKAVSLALGMLFHSWTFLLFFLGFYPVFLLSKGTRFKDPWLLICSYLFYGWWNPLYLVLIAWSTTVDYSMVALMARSRSRGFWLALSVVNNLALLGFFKYGGFVTENLNRLLFRSRDLLRAPASGRPAAGGDLLLRLPVAQLHHRLLPREDRAGTELHSVRHLRVALPPTGGRPHRAGREPPAPAPAEGHADTGRRIGRVVTFVVGLFKKVALADYLALYVDRIYDVPEQFGGTALAFATFAFGWQIYFDFSGYTDMARGIGRLMGFRLMLNFNNPYLATGLGDFWNRWHISLSTWFRDYVYIPLGGNRKGDSGHLSEHGAHHADLRPLAWRGVDLRHLGRPPCPGAFRHQGVGRDELLPEQGPSPGETAAGVRLRDLHLDLLPGGESG